MKNTTALVLFVLFSVPLHAEWLTEEMALYKVKPKTNVQLFQLVQQATLSKEVVLWSGVEESLDSPVQLLASPKAFETFDSEVLKPLNLSYVIADENVTINFSSLNSTSTEPAQMVRNKIPGTSLFTGIYYKISNKRFPSGRITYTSETNDYAANFLQVDLDPEQIPQYERGEKWYDDDQWVFIEAPDSPGWYELRNKVINDGITTWSYSKVGGGYHIIVSRKKEDVEKLSEGGEWRVHALWRPVKVKDENYYKLQNKNYPTGTITWTERKYRNISHYIQVDVKPEHVGNFYEEGGKWYDDALFAFTAAKVNLHAKIHSFSYPNETSFPISQFQNSTRDTYFHIYTVYNPSEDSTTRSMGEVFKDNTTVTFSLEDGIDSFQDVRLSVEVPWFAAGSVEAGREVLWGSDKTITLIGSKTNEVTKDISVPTGGATKVFVYSKWFENLIVPVNATMEVTGDAGDGVELPGDFVMEQLEGGWKEYEVLSSEESSVKLNIPVLFNGSFWYHKLVTEDATNESERCGQ